MNTKLFVEMYILLNCCSDKEKQNMKLLKNSINV